MLGSTQQDGSSANAPIPSSPQGNKRYLTVGGKVKPPTPIETPQPASDAPPQSGKPKFKGTVILKFGINEQGTVDWVRVVRSVDGKVDKAAIDIVRKWTFSPATRDGVPVPIETNAEVKLTLY